MRHEWNGGYIEANEIQIGEGTTFGQNVDIKVRGKFQIGDHGHIGDSFHANAQSITIGDYFYHSDVKGAGMWIGGGGSASPFAELVAGDRCVMHSGSINLATVVKIGDDVGLSPGVDIITHGFWASELEGFPRKVEGVFVGNNTIVGWGSTVLQGSFIPHDCVIGARSVVTGKLVNPFTVYAGNPAKRLRSIETPSIEAAKSMVQEMIGRFKWDISHYQVPEPRIVVSYPVVEIESLEINLEAMTCTGTHCPVTDFFRNFLRRRGIRIYHPRGFGSNLPRK